MNSFAERSHDGFNRFFGLLRALRFFASHSRKYLFCNLNFDTDIFIEFDYSFNLRLLLLLICN